MKSKYQVLTIILLFFCVSTFARSSSEELTLHFKIDTIQVTNSSSCTACNGIATVQVSGGILPYTFLWNNSDTAHSITGLCPGVYTVLILDANNDTLTGSCSIGPLPVSIKDTVANTCNSTGIVALYPFGGTAPYTYSWAVGATTSSINGLTTGTYKYMVTDANGCSTTDSAAVKSGLSIKMSSTSVHCGGDSTGTAIVTNVAGGTGPYTFIWEPVSGDSDTLTGLSAGTYTVSINDNFGCSGTDSVKVIQSAVLAALIDTVADTGSCSGRAKVVMSGGVAPYTFTWSSQSGNTLDSAFGLCYGTYYVCANDANGCSVCDSVHIRNAAVKHVTTGIANFLSNSYQLELYPNPARNQLNLVIKESGVSYCDIDAYDMLGREVMQKENVEINGSVVRIDVSALTAGNYMLRISDNSHNEIKPFVIGW